MGPLILLIDRAFTIYTWLLLARVIMSWIQGLDWKNPVVQFIYKATEPVLRVFRGIIPSVGGLDLSPLIVFIVLDFARRLIIDLLISVF